MYVCMCSSLHFLSLREKQNSSEKNAHIQKQVYNTIQWTTSKIAGRNGLRLFTLQSNLAMWKVDWVGGWEGGIDCYVISPSCLAISSSSDIYL